MVLKVLSTNNFVVNFIRFSFYFNSLKFCLIFNTTTNITCVHKIKKCHHNHQYVAAIYNENYFQACSLRQRHLSKYVHKLKNIFYIFCFFFTSKKLYVHMFVAINC